MDNLEDRIEEVIDELRSKTAYWKRLGYRAIDEIRRLKAREAELTKQIAELRGELESPHESL